MHVPDGIKPFLLPLICTVLAVTIFVARQVSAAPTQTAPGGNIATPLNAGSNPQTKTGSLTVNSTVTANAFSVGGNTSVSSACIPGGCANTWPSASYSTPTINQVLSAGNSTTGSITFTSPGGWAFGSGAVRTTWPTYYGYYGYTSSLSIGFGGFQFCPSGYLVCGINSLGPVSLECCNVQIGAN